LLLLDQIPNFNLSSQIAECAKQHQVSKVVEVDRIANASSEIKNGVALEVEQSCFSWNVAINNNELI
jgi:hypothetical protein